MKQILAAVIACTMVFASCGENTGEADPGGSEEVSFGESDQQCASVQLRNEEDDQQVLQTATTCFFAELDLGNPVVIDIDRPTVEGDSIFTRYDFDGDTVLIVTDTRLDEFGRGNAGAQRCDSVVATDWMPEGVDCEPIEHGGFVEAS